MKVICRNCGKKTSISAPELNLESHPEFHIELEGKKFYSQCYNCRQMEFIELSRWEGEGGYVISIEK